MGRKNDDTILGDIREQIPEPDAFFWVKSDCRFVDDKQSGFGEETLCDANSLFHSAREST
ncbi:hypothetical protein ABY42_16305 (plasmid) [Haloferax gibbonsii]|uniref:Uncharacterized protein n=1 Tax=Haloferax gibbonsii TaxID=35746 RepID=A0A0K1IY29_HALGI|nr:hypothetical protein ABY42_16305 [Haloferax gibbonsii]